MVGREDPHSPWPLFCGDLELARAWVANAWQHPHFRCVQTLHWALNLGMAAEVRLMLQEALADPALGGGLPGVRFRLARLDRWANAYGQLGQHSTDQRHPSATPWIQLNGGIGDHLEEISRLKAWASATHAELRLVAEPQRVQQLQRLLPDVNLSSQIPPSEPAVHAKAWLAGMEPPLPPPVALCAERHWPGQAPGNRLLCCWSAAGQGDRFSAWLRSIPFELVVELYRTLIHQGWAPAAILDITAWRPWEDAVLRNMGIARFNPALGDGLDLATHVARSATLVSIDTALVHLCAAMQHPVRLLLPLFSDERWIDLLQTGSSYANVCTVLRQRQFGCWQPLLHLLALSLSNQ